MNSNQIGSYENGYIYLSQLENGYMVSACRKGNIVQYNYVMKYNIKQQKKI